MTAAVLRLRAFGRKLTGDGFRFFHDFVVLAGGQVLAKLAGFLAFAWLARVLEPVQYGGVEYVVGLAMFCSLLVDGGLGVIGTRRVARDPGEVATLAFQIPLARLLIALAAVPLMVGIAVLAVRDQVPMLLIWLFAFSLLLAPWRQQWLFQARDRMVEASAAETLRMVVFAGGVWLLVRTSADVAAVGYAELAAVAAMAAWFLVFQHLRITPMRLTGSLKGFGALMREGVAVGSTNMVWALNQYAPLFLLGAMIGGVSIAWYAGAARIVTSLLQFSNTYHFNLYPSVARYHARADGSLGKVLARSLRVTGWAGTFVALALTALAAPLVRLALGPKLPEAAPLLQIMCWMIPITLWSGHARWALAAAGAQAKVLRAQLIGLATTAMVAVGLGQVVGVTGYAIGAVAGFVAVWIASHRFAAGEGCDPPRFALVVPPLLLAAGLYAAIAWADLNWWQAGFALLAFPALAPLIDRRLIADIGLLGAAKRESHRGA